ncbi:MAG TPA: ABC transporter permease [Terriglobales bacterium]|nr:ABC transporter permease [Terriglobales bacterium]
MATTTTATPSHPPKLVFSEILSFAYDTFCANKVRFALTALGMVIGTASLILVVTIGMTGKQYVLNQIQSIGANMIEAEYQGGGQRNVTPDLLRIDDMNAVLQEVPGIVAASPVVPLDDRIPIGGGKERDLRILGVFPEYTAVRNLVVISGRFFDTQDAQARNKVGVMQQKLAEQIYGSVDNAIGKVVKVGGLPFTIIGTFRERVNTFGMSEVTDNSLVIPYTVSRFFTDSPDVRQLYFSAAEPSMVLPVTEQVRKVIQSRHRPESVYVVQNLTELVAVANRTANALTMVLLLIAAVTLLVSGIGIMNIMLATVSSRVHEIGIRKAIGATSREIRFQFLSEAILISLVGGFIGVVIGLALPFSVRFLTEYRIPISGLSAIVAIAVSSLVGILFGTVPAARAAKLDPVESLRYE